MRINNFQNLVLLLLFCGTTILAGCTSSRSQPPADPVTVQLSWEHGVQFLGFYVAEERDYYADENLSVTLEPLAGAFETDDIPKKVAAGEIDFGVGGSSL